MRAVKVERNGCVIVQINFYRLTDGRALLLSFT